MTGKTDGRIERERERERERDTILDRYHSLLSLLSGDVPATESVLLHIS